MSSPVQLTHEQREQLLRAAAQITAAMQAYLTALRPAIQAAAAEFRRMYETLQAAGLLDEHGQPVHQGGNAEDCPACRGTNPDYPFICPGPAPEEPHAECDCPPTQAGLTLCPACPGNTSKEPRP